MAEQSLYERLGGVFAIAAVIDRFSDEVVKNAVAGRGSDNPALREWHTAKLARLPGLKFMRTLWVCAVAGGPRQKAWGFVTGLNLHHMGLAWWSLLAVCFADFYVRMCSMGVIQDPTFMTFAHLLDIPDKLVGP